MRTSDSIDALAAALVALQADIGNIKATSTNPFYESKYADLASIIREVRPLLAKHGLAVIQGAEGEVLTTRVIHESGQWMESTLNLSVPKWTNPQDVGKAMTYGRRYGLAAMLCVAQEDDDGNSLAKKAEEVKLISPEQSVELQALIDEIKPDMPKLLRYFKVKAIGDLTEEQYGKAVEMLERKRG